MVTGLAAVVVVSLGTILLGWQWTVDSLPFAIFFLLVTPVMAFAKEVLFRAWLPQFLGTWIRSGLACFLLPVPLFALFHQPAGPLQ